MVNIGTDILGLPPTVGGLSGTEWVPIVQGGTTKRTQTTQISLSGGVLIIDATIEYVMSGGTTSTVPLGVNASGLNVPFNCTITTATIWGDTTGAAVVDIWKCARSQFDGGVTHPVVGDSITAGTPPTIILGGSIAQNTTLTGWTKSLTAGDVLWYNVVSVTNFRSLTVSLQVLRQVP